MCSLDDTLTDLMCHPEDYNAWVNGITAALRGSSGKDGPLSEGPTLRLPYMDSGCGGCAGGAGHSGAMRLAASLVKDLLRNHRLDKLLGWGAVHGVEEGSSRARPGSGGSSGCLPTAAQWGWQRSFRRSGSMSSSYPCAPPLVTLVFRRDIHAHIIYVT